jgi:hypothetical protein
MVGSGRREGNGGIEDTVVCDPWGVSLLRSGSGSWMGPIRGRRNPNSGKKSLLITPARRLRLPSIQYQRLSVYVPELVLARWVMIQLKAVGNLFNSDPN